MNKIESKISNESDRSSNSLPLGSRVDSSEKENRKRILIYVILLIILFITLSVGTAILIQIIVYDEKLVLLYSNIISWIAK